ncbi:hypothetical protein DID88_004776 [Monilinia fructigena]|uniref:DUF1996 domain-containing protein n=1 Tax=Monilinia fructigena TaxID=38457 RepID=A0A395IRI2_9HELO|nr:hypothetical protein DID88_004776 [Monilinia fructigena]
MDPVALENLQGNDELLAGNCTSCSVSQDKSAYWTPSIYFKHAATGKFELVEQVGGMLAYYLLYGDNIKAFPKGFSMIAGNNDLQNIKGDDVTGPMDALPGDNPIQSGPGLATSGSAPANTGKASSTKASSTSTKASSKATTTSAVVPTLSYSAGSSIAANRWSLRTRWCICRSWIWNLIPHLPHPLQPDMEPLLQPPQQTTLVTTPAPPPFSQHLTQPLPAFISQ